MTRERKGRRDTREKTKGIIDDDDTAAWIIPRASARVYFLLQQPISKSIVGTDEHFTSEAKRRKKDRERRVVENKETRRVVAIGESKKYKDEMRKRGKETEEGHFI